MILAAVLAACAAAAATSAAAQAQGRFTCGGVGVGEQDRMKAEASQHDLMLIFSSPTGAYVADVDVRIADAQGRVVVQGRCGGPLMLADLGGNAGHGISADTLSPASGGDDDGRNTPGCPAGSANCAAQ